MRFSFHFPMHDNSNSPSIHIDSFYTHIHYNLTYQCTISNVAETYPLHAIGKHSILGHLVAITLTIRYTIGRQRRVKQHI